MEIVDSNSSCRITRYELQTLLERAEFGANTAVFNMYFRSCMCPGGPPVCNNCNRPIAEHPATADDATPHQAYPVPGTVALMATGSTSVLGAVVDPNALPRGIMRNENSDVRVSRKHLFLAVCAGMILLVAIIIFVVLVSIGALRSVPLLIIAPLVLVVVAFFLSLLPRERSVEFNHGLRQWESRKRYIIWRCCSIKVRHGSFDDILGVTHLRVDETGICDATTIARVGMAIRGTTEIVPLHDVSMSEQPSVEQSWKSYVENLVHRR